MKKLLLLAVLLCTTLMANAEGKKGIYYLTTPAYYQVSDISRNGLWACGTKYDEETESSYGFRWNLTTSKIEMLGGVCFANGVANDGTVVGSYYTSEGISSGETIEVPGTWQNGQWQMLELPNEEGSWAAAISPDGRYITGVDNHYNAYIWTDGKITKKFPVKQNGCNMAYSISPDGQIIGGWSYAHDNDVRNSGYWAVSDGLFHDLEPDVQGSPWQAVKRFSADSKKMLYWGDYHEDEDGAWGLHAIYDAATNDTTMIYPIEDDPFNIDFYDMNGDATIVTGYEANGDGEEYGIIWHDGQTETAQAYLESRGASFEGMNIMGGYVQEYSLIGVKGVDDEAKTFAIYYYDNGGDYHTMVVAFDREMDMTPPLNIEAKQMPGLKSVELSWEAPLGDKSTLKGYNIYRDGVKITSEPISELTYFDNDLDYATYIYKVTAVYEGGETEQYSETSVTLVGKDIQGPTALKTRQKGYNSALAMWNAPESNLPSVSYYGDESTRMVGFGGASVSFESGVLFPADEMNLYDGFSIAGVTFYPGTEQESWTVNIYTHENGVLKLLSSCPVDQTLKYGVKNTVKLPEILKLTSGQDILVGIETVVNNSSYDVQKVYEDCLKEGYTDLIRQIGESDFYSINSLTSGYDVCWATGLLLAPEGTTNEIDEIDHYSVYLNNVEKATTLDESYLEKALADGNYNVAVDVVYKDGRRSARIDSDMTIAANKAAFKAIEPTLSTEGNKVKASWKAPIDDDQSVLSYCGNTPASLSPITSETVSNILARVDYLPAELQTYGDYQINAVEFYPMSESTFTVEIQESGESVEMIPVDEIEIGSWNTVKLDEPITIDPTKTYSYIVYCDDCPNEGSPLAIDTENTIDNASYMMVDGDTEWSSIQEKAYLDGNWLMRIDVADPNGDVLPVSSYDVYVDGTNESNQTALEFSKTMTETQGQHKLRVDANYTQLGKAITGKSVDFQFDGTECIRNLSTDSQFSTLNSQLYNVAGQRVNSNAKGVVIKKGKKVIQ